MNIKRAREEADRMALLLDASLTAIRSKNLFSDSFISDPTPCIVFTLDGPFHLVNPAFTRILGYASRDLKGKQIISIIHPDDIEPTMEAMGYASKGYEARYFINRYQHRDGGWVWTLWHPQQKANDPIYGFGFCSLLERCTDVDPKEFKAGFIDEEKLNINIH